MEKIESSLSALFAALLSRSSDARHRASIVIEGDHGWIISCYQQLAKKLQGLSLFVSSEAYDSITDSAPIKHLHPKQYKQALGMQYPVLTWDLFGEIHADALAATTGGLLAGGILVVLKPVFADNNGDTSLFNKRLFNAIDKLEACLFLRQSASTEVTMFLNSLPTLTHEAQPLPFKLSSEQNDCLDQIKHVLTGHRNRPLIIRADRGRGKSSALGVSAARAIEDLGISNVIVVSNQQDSIKVLQEHFNMTCNSDASKKRLEVWPSDKLLIEKPRAALLIIDEAATLPLAVLEKVFRQYSRVVAASTLHGYEGSGRGFELKLSALLSQLQQKATWLQLNHPMRWADNDPLEAFTNSSFVLNAELNDLDAAPIKFDSANASLEWIDKEQLTNNEALLREVFALLVLAHYQTKPSDLALLLDEPSIKLVLIRQRKILCGAVLLVDESIELDDASAHEILLGEKRLKGHLVPQALARFYADTRWLNIRSLRVMRIVIRPDLQALGFGSFALDQISQYAKNASYSALTVSFGIDARLYGFWYEASFNPVRVGYKPDAASGVNSVMMIKALDKPCHTLISENLAHFHHHLVEGLSSYYQTLETQSAIAILSSGTPTSFGLELKATNKLKLIADGRYPHFDAWAELKSLLVSCLRKDGLRKSNMTELNITNLVEYVLKERKLEYFAPDIGKKQWDKDLRESTKTMLSLFHEKKHLDSKA